MRSRPGSRSWAGAGGRLVVVGDTLLDVDLEGSAERLAPDAPVPVVDVATEHQRPGGAGLAALLAARAGADVVLVTALGEDEGADRLRGLLTGQLRLCPLRLNGATSRKTRVLADGVAVTRLDTGSGRAADLPVPQAVLGALEDADAILVADYGRGVAALPELRRALTAAGVRVPVIWDPHPRGSSPVPGCALVTPNAAEAEAFAGCGDGAEQGRRLSRRWQAAAVAVTVGRRGALLTRTEPWRFDDVPLPADAAGSAPYAGRRDTCGAGDAFAAAATAALLAGADTVEAVQTAVSRATDFVRAGAATTLATPVVPVGAMGVPAGAIGMPVGAIGMPVGAVGRPVFPVGGDRPGNPVPAVDGIAVAEQIRAAGGRIVATGGCFDLLHRGHVSLLTQARALGDALIVCLNSDDSVRRAKGEGRPIVSQADRARVLSALSCVDGILTFDDPTPTALLDRLRPDVWVKGSDYADQPIPEADVVLAGGGRVVLLDTVDGYSTSGLVALSRRVHGPGPSSPPPSPSNQPLPSTLSQPLPSTLNKEVS